MSKAKLAIHDTAFTPPQRKALGAIHLAHATKAYHKVGEISRGVPYDTPEDQIYADIFDESQPQPLEDHLCVVDYEDDENYYGAWITGIAYFNVRFPKATTRPLTDKEWNQIKDSRFRINSQPSWGISGMKRL
jgi:hypothetical protein